MHHAHPHLGHHVLLRRLSCSSRRLFRVVLCLRLEIRHLYTTSPRSGFRELATPCAVSRGRIFPPAAHTRACTPARTLSPTVRPTRSEGRDDSARALTPAWRWCKRPACCGPKASAPTARTSTAQAALIISHARVDQRWPLECPSDKSQCQKDWFG